MANCGIGGVQRGLYHCQFVADHPDRSLYLKLCSFPLARFLLFGDGLVLHLPLGLVIRLGRLQKSLQLFDTDLEIDDDEPAPLPPPVKPASSRKSGAVPMPDDQVLERNIKNRRVSSSSGFGPKSRVNVTRRRSSIIEVDEDEPVEAMMESAKPSRKALGKRKAPDQDNLISDEEEIEELPQPSRKALGKRKAAEQDAPVGDDEEPVRSTKSAAAAPRPKPKPKRKTSTPQPLSPPPPSAKSLGKRKASAVDDDDEDQSTATGATAARRSFKRTASGAVDFSTSTTSTDGEPKKKKKRALGGGASFTDLRSNFDWGNTVCYSLIVLHQTSILTSLFV